ncbi:M23 family metallopeptidase [Mycetocola zhujimingii]|nr:M23 family metallopeptidase [Mycetocola zhujimingii]
MSDQNPELAPQGSTGDPAGSAGSFPTRASLRKAAGLRAAAAAPEASEARTATTEPGEKPVARVATPIAQKPAPSKPSVTKSAPHKAATNKAATKPVTSGSRWRNIRSTVVMALVVPGIFGTIALPAYAFETTPDATVAPVHDTGAQSLIVNDWTAESVSRDSYSATSPEELQASKAALAAAAAEAAAAAARAANKTNSKSNSNSYSDSTAVEEYTGPAGAWIRPVGGKISSAYGPRGLICNGAGCSNSFHDGVDFSGSCGTPIKAVSAGRVTFVGAAGSYGNRVIVDHGGGVESIYGHLQGGSYRVSVGDLVEPGTVVAGIGATGVVTGCHLDLKISVNGSFTNPVPFLANRGLQL